MDVAFAAVGVDSTEMGPAPPPGSRAASESSAGPSPSLGPGSDPSTSGDIWRDARFDGRGAGALELLARGAYLTLAFLPVFFLAVPLLLAAESPAIARFASSLARGATNAEDATEATRRALRRRAWAYLHFSVSLCGAALVKWAQWASVRRDMFPEDFCDAMSALHDDAPRHSMRQTLRIVQRELGVPASRVFSHFPDEPVASGSIAQVYRCVLRPEIATACAARDPELARRLRASRGSGGGNPRRPPRGGGAAGLGSATEGGTGGLRGRRGWGPFGFFGDGPGVDADALVAAVGGAGPASDARAVAVKVRHPGVERQIFLDFQILKRAAKLVSGLPALRGLNLEETLGQFSHTMTAQTDLRTEASNLRRFGRNFRGERSVLAPWPVAGLVTEGLLCETFERGEALSGAIRRGCEHNTTTCALGVDTYLKMLLRDNFLHSDLHPGNILYQVSPAPGTENRAALARSSSSSSRSAAEVVKLVLLDFGIADELPTDVRERFLTFLFCLVRQDGVAAAECILGWSSAQTCRGADADALREDMRVLVDEMCAVRRAQVDIDAVLKAVMVLLRRRGVSIDAVYASLVVSLCVLVGFANSLDENLNLFDVAVTAFLSYSVTGDIAGKLYAA